MKKLISLFVAIVALAGAVSAEETALEPGFVSLFDGKTLDGWKCNNKPEEFTIEDGAIKANGSCTHLFYAGKVSDAKFKNYELKLDVMTRKSSNGGVFIGTTYQQEGWPSGFEIQVNNTQSDPQKSGGLYNVIKNPDAFEDDKWMKFEITVKDGDVKVKINGKKIADYKHDPSTTKLPADGGTFAFQAHDPGSTTLYKNIRVKVLK
jgi:Domain of Unknown Function (DUF1080)